MELSKVKVQHEYISSRDKFITIYLDNECTDIMIVPILCHSDERFFSIFAEMILLASHDEEININMYEDENCFRGIRVNRYTYDGSKVVKVAEKLK